jgi:hypothetical protein
MSFFRIQVRWSEEKLKKSERDERCAILIRDQDKAGNAEDAFHRLWCAPAAMLEAALSIGALVAMMEAAVLARGARVPYHPIRWPGSKLGRNPSDTNT